MLPLPAGSIAQHRHLLDGEKVSHDELEAGGRRHRVRRGRNTRAAWRGRGRVRGELGALQTAAMRPSARRCNNNRNVGQDRATHTCHHLLLPHSPYYCNIH